MVSAEVNVGDGTYLLRENDKVIADNGRSVSVQEINYTALSFAPVEWYQNTVEFMVLDGNFNLGEPVLRSGEEWNEHNLTIRLNGFKVVSGGKGSIYLPVTYANVTVTSAEESIPTPTPTPTPQDVNIYGVEVEPGEMSFSYSFTTDVDSLCKAHYSGDEGAPEEEWEWDYEGRYDYGTDHSGYVGSLEESTNYWYYFNCTADNASGRSETGFVRTNPILVDIVSGPNVTGITNESAVITWRTSLIAPRHSVFYAKEGYGFYEDYFEESGGGHLEHSRTLSGLEPNTTYQVKVRSCWTVCTDSLVREFTTRETIVVNDTRLEPYVSFNKEGPVNQTFGEHLLLMLSITDPNSDGEVVSAELTFEDWNRTRAITPVMGGDPNSFLPAGYTGNSVLSLTFWEPGTKTLTLTATNNHGLTNTTTLVVNVGPREHCTSTQAIYFPSDAGCNKDWNHGGEGGNIDYNNDIKRCNAFEICDPNLDFIPRDAEACCNGDRDFSDFPLISAYGYDKNAACDEAVAETRALTLRNLTLSQSMQMCKTKYIVKGFGSHAIYMKDYYTAECCCKDNKVCGSYPRWQAYNPWPASNIRFDELWCYWTDYGAWNSPRDGWWHSDTNPESNNMALADIPTHASVNVLNTGTCVDYSYAVTTSLRKAGYRDWQVMSARAPGHAYNILRLPGDSEYTFVDTVGNSAGEFFSGGGWDWTVDGDRTDHCDFDDEDCANDRGWWYCPDVRGC